MKFTTACLKVAAITVLASSLLACGGGGGGGGGPVASTLPFPLKTAYKNDFLDVRPYSFTITGSVTVSGNTGTVTGSGNYIQSATSAATFEGTAGFQKVKTQSGNLVVTVNGVSANQAVPASSQTFFVDANHVLTGYTATGSYNVPTAAVNIPATAKVGESGIAGTFVNYTSSAKLTQQGTNTITWALAADTASTAILRLTQTLTSATNLPAGSQVDSFRVTADGSVTRINSVATLVGTSSGTLTFNY